MNKELLITLIKKDVNELGIVLEGLLENNNLPKSIINLSIDKAENIAFCLKQLLGENEQVAQNQVCEKEEEVIIPPMEEKNTETAITEEISIKQTQEGDSSFVQEEEEDKEEKKEEKTIIIEKEVSIIHSEQEQETEEIKVITVAESVQVDVSLNEKLHKEDTTLGNIISTQKIEDLKQAISIGDRFRFQRELFGGNGELMNKTIADLNNASSLEKALNYISSNFSWDNSDENVKDFLNLLERKFID